MADDPIIDIGPSVFSEDEEWKKLPDFSHSYAIDFTLTNRQHPR